MSNIILRQLVSAEIENLHVFFADWFSGRAPSSDEYFHENLERRLARDFVIIPPGGSLLGGAEISAMIRAAHGSNPKFRIAIRNIVIRRQTGRYVLATYEEWQRHARNSNPPDNARLATVMLETGEGYIWHHLHETWLPREIMEAGPYDF